MSFLLGVIATVFGVGLAAELLFRLVRARGRADLAARRGDANRHARRKAEAEARRARKAARRLADLRGLR